MVHILVCAIDDTESLSRYLPQLGYKRSRIDVLLRAHSLPVAWALGFVPTSGDRSFLDGGRRAGNDMLSAIDGSAKIPTSDVRITRSTINLLPGTDGYHEILTSLIIVGLSIYVVGLVIVVCI